MYTFLYQELNIMVDLNSIKEVKEFVYEMHKKYDWLAGSTWDWKGAQVFKDHKLVGRVSYNGMVWDSNEKEVVIDND